MPELLDREVGVLQRHRGKRDEAVGARAAEFGELLVLDSDDLARDVALRLVPGWIDAERLDVYALFVHLGDAPGPDFADSRPALVFQLLPQQGQRFRYHTVRVHIDGL